jgi:hypothetical protein
MGGVGRQNWARGRIPIFRKIHLYGKSAKSTHGHTNGKPNQPVFSHLAFFLPLPRRRAYPVPTLEPLPSRGLPEGGLSFFSPTNERADGPTLEGPTLEGSFFPANERTNERADRRTDLP